MAYRPSNHRTEHGIFEKLNVGKDWKHSFWQKSQQFFVRKPSVSENCETCQETLIQCFSKIHEKVFL